MKKLLVAFGTNFAYLATQGIGIGAIYWYARQMQSNGAASLPWIGDYITISPKGLLWVVVAVASLAFIASASFIFLSRTMILRIVEEHYAQSLGKLVLLTARLPDPRAVLASRIFADHGLTRLAAGCKRGALTTVAFSNAISGMVGGIAAAGFLFWVDAPLTVLILLSVVLGALFLYPLALRAVELLKLRMQAHFAFRQEATRFHQSGNPSDSLATTSQLARAYIARKQLKNEFTLRTEIGIAAILTVVVFYLANQSLSGGADWAIFIAYIGALRLVLAACSQAIRAFGSVARFYPYIVRYYLVLKELEKIDQRPFGTVLPGDRLRLGALKTGEEIFARTGERLAVVAGNPKSDLKLALLSARSVGSDLPLRTVFVAPDAASADDAAVAVLDPSQFLDGNDVQILAGALKDKVTLVVRQDPKEMGSLGEEQLLTVLDGEFRRMAPLGTSASEAALEEFAQRVARAARKRRLVDDEEEEDEQ